MAFKTSSYPNSSFKKKKKKGKNGRSKNEKRKEKEQKSTVKLEFLRKGRPRAQDSLAISHSYLLSQFTISFPPKPVIFGGSQPIYCNLYRDITEINIYLRLYLLHN